MPEREAKITPVIICVDDDESTRNLFPKILGKTVAKNGGRLIVCVFPEDVITEARSLMSAAEPWRLLVVTDGLMQSDHMGGLQLIAELQKELPPDRVQFVMYSSTIELQDQAETLGAQFIFKQPDKLKSAAQAFLDRTS